MLATCSAFRSFYTPVNFVIANEVILRLCVWMTLIHRSPGITFLKMLVKMLLRVLQYNVLFPLKGLVMFSFTSSLISNLLCKTCSPVSILLSLKELKQWEFSSKFVVILFIWFLPYAGFHSKNPLYYTTLHTVKSAVSGTSGTKRLLDIAVFQISEHYT